VKVFRESGRLSDVVGRLGPTEFVVMAAGTDASGVRKLAERFLQAAEQALREEGGGMTPVQMRAGCYAVSDFRTASQTSLQAVDLLVRATMAVRRSQTDAEGARIRFFNHESERVPH
jgi:GGDEF domain-containing protein